ncbi:MAG: GerMN domain-containing protein [Spirochaetaceae bacterium]|nr:GerMN domain-containing protein [Spirochaetaceae bacterium]
MLPRLSSEELSVRRYVEETLLGPASPRTAPLFPRETRLRSLLYRDGVVYADLSERAALPPLEDRPPREGEVFRSLRALDRGIRRNFPQVKDVRLFINGHPAAGGARGVISAGDDDCRDRPPVPGLAPRFTKRAEKYAVMPPSSASNSTCSRARVVSSSLSMSLPETGVRLWRSLPFPTAS